MSEMPTIRDFLRRVDDGRETSRGQSVRLLSDLTPLLEVASESERQLERDVAPRFNVFTYLRVDELGLSRIIADLLDPIAEHGQGTSFLEAMLDTLPETRGRFGALRSTATSPVKVVRERRTTTGSRIDVTVDIPFDSGSFCLAFENKPYAGDQDGQLKTYLDYLGEEYGTHFLLVYLPPDDRPPDNANLPQADRERQRGHFRVMPYVGGDTSLRNWFATCRDLCDAEWPKRFLRDAELFCTQRFGGSPMTIDPETRSVHEYLTNNPSDLPAALAVHRAWPLVRAEVCKRFLNHLRHLVLDRLERLRPDIGDIRVGYRYRDEQRYSKLWITRGGWVRYDDTSSNVPGRTVIKLQTDQTGPNRWYWGVCSPKGGEQHEREGQETPRRTL